LGVNFTHGILDIGEPMAVPVIRQLKKLASHNWAAAVIRDAPPGASCPVVEVLRGADFALLVTEPTPFGLHDLALVAQLTGELGIPTGVVINRDGIGDDQVQAYCQERGLPLLMRIPLEKEIGAGIAEGKLLVDIHPEYRQRFWQAFRQIEALLESGKRAA